jgi:hypothetical protein
LRRVGGFMSRAELGNFVVNDVECKRWLCHPKADVCQQELSSAANTELEERNTAIRVIEEERLSALSIPAIDVARDYLAAIERYQTVARMGRLEDFDETSRLLAQIASHAKRLEAHGYPEASDRDLYGSRSQIIPRILAIRHGGGVGYELDSTMGIMNAIKQAQINNRKFHTVYLIAVNVYQRQEASNPPAWYQTWVEEIKASIEAGEKTYVRPRKYDQLLSLIFPEMATGLSKSFGTEDYFPNGRTPMRQMPNSNRSDALSDAAWSRDRSDSRNPYWLVGQELERWKRAYPNAARNFFGNSSDKFDDK